MSEIVAQGAAGAIPGLSVEAQRHILVLEN